MNKRKLLATTAMVLTIASLSFGCQTEKASAGTEARFKYVTKIPVDGNVYTAGEVIVDTQTNIEYAFFVCGESVHFSPLYDTDGKPLQHGKKGK